MLFIALAVVLSGAAFRPALADIYSDNLIDWFNINAPGNCQGAATLVGNLPGSVPEPYNGIFTAAAQATGADPIIIATIFYTEHRGFPPPPPPYGNGPLWASSSAGAQGPFQFVPDTWRSYGNGGNVQDLKDAAGGAGRYIVALGGKNGIPVGDVNDPYRKGTVINVLASYNAGPAGNFGNGETQQYIRIGEAIYQKIKTGGSTTTPPPVDTTQTNVPPECSSNFVPVNGSLAEKVIAIARHELGHVGWSPYAASAENWCADFVSWVFQTAGSPFTGGTRGGWDIAAVSELQAWFQRNGGWAPRDSAKPQPGDVVIYQIGASHTNIVTAVNYDPTGTRLLSFTTIGGNQVSDDLNKSQVSQNVVTVGDKTWGQISGFGRKR